MLQGFTGHMLDMLVTFGKELLLPFLTIGFVAAVILRITIYWTIKRENWFVEEFDRRLQRYINIENPHGSYSFSVTLKRILEKTFYELFQTRSLMRRRKWDHIMEPSDRLFLIQHGAAHLVRDTVRHAATLRKDPHKEEKDELIEVSKQVLSRNPVFTKVFGMFPVGALNDFLNILPGLFIIGGIFGTFLGIMKALPELQGMNPADTEGTKLIMDEFLIKIAFSMSTSTMGILYSVVFSIFNAFVNPEKLFVEVVNRYERALHELWRRSENNEVPQNHRNFDQNRDPNEALAELALQKELAIHDQKVQRRLQEEQRNMTPPPYGKNDDDQNGPRGGNQAA